MLLRCFCIYRGQIRSLWMGVLFALSSGAGGALSILSKDAYAIVTPNLLNLIQLWYHQTEASAL